MILMMFGLKSVSKTDAKTDKNSELKTDYKDRNCHLDIGGFDCTGAFCKKQSDF